MARAKVLSGSENPFNIHEDPPTTSDKHQAHQGRQQHANGDPHKGLGDNDSDTSDCSVLSQKHQRRIDPAAHEDMIKFAESFQGITERYRLIDRIGEGTFSTVYKAEDLHYHHYINDWDVDSPHAAHWVSPPVKKGQPRQQKQRPRYVAIKRIYVTSSPVRIQNELELLNDLKLCKSICPLITAFRYQDQVVAVLPYYRHQDFREFFKSMRPGDMQIYFRSLFQALASVHKEGIIHRDIKPTNFLYDYYEQRGVLVDFGLAEREGTESSHCLCCESAIRRKTRYANSYAAQAAAENLPSGYRKEDTRPSKRANRAGTRGFRAPEVLFKCTAQTTKIDIWSAGVIFLTILSRRFPFFNSADDIDAMVEIASIFGRRRMKHCALLHGQIFDCTIPSIGEKGYTFEKLMVWSDLRPDPPEEGVDLVGPGEKLALQFLEACLELDPKKRIGAEEALAHEFLAEDTGLVSEDDEMEVVE